MTDPFKSHRAETTVEDITASPFLKMLFHLQPPFRDSQLKALSISDGSYNVISHKVKAYNVSS